MFLLIAPILVLVFFNFNLLSVWLLGKLWIFKLKLVFFFWVFFNSKNKTFLTKWYLSCLIRFQTMELEKIEENLIDISSQ